MILKTIEALKATTRIGVIEGDTAAVTIDADKVIAGGALLFRSTPAVIATWIPQ